MSLINQVRAQALLMSQQAEEVNEKMLNVLCQAAIVNLTGRLRPGLTPEDCKADFVAAASLYALAALAELDDMSRLEQVTAGDITLRQSGSNAAVGCLRYQADILMAPYVVDGFCFRRV